MVGRDSSVGMVTRERAGRSQFPIPAVARDFCLLQYIQTAATSTHTKAPVSTLRSVVLYLHSPCMLSWRVHWQSMVYICFYVLLL